jgi:hypothetical protein
MHPPGNANVCRKTLPPQKHYGQGVKHVQDELQAKSASRPVCGYHDSHSREEGGDGCGVFCIFPVLLKGIRRPLPDTKGLCVLRFSAVLAGAFQAISSFFTFELTDIMPEVDYSLVGAHVCMSGV